MIKLKKNPPSKKNKQKELRKGHRKFLKEQGALDKLAMDKDPQDMTYEEKRKYRWTTGKEIVKRAAWNSVDSLLGGIPGVGPSVAGIKFVAKSVVKNPKVIKKFISNVIKKTKGATK